MTVAQHTPIKLWDLQKSIIPPRSRLYHLEPIGVGTLYVESLTSYVTRLAEAHCVSTRMLVWYEIGPLIKEGYVFDSQVRGINEILGGSGNLITAINGTGLMATRLVQALEMLTLRVDLRYLTMLSWANVLSHQGLIRTTKAWCPICFQAWKAGKQLIYEPLIWAFNPITVCSCHHQSLQTQCPHCFKPMSLLDGRSRPGYCSKCQGWLGVPPKVEASDNGVLSEDESKWQHWVTNSIGDLLATAPCLSSPLPRERIKEVVSNYVSQVARENLSAFSYMCGMDNCTALKLWRFGKAIPKLSTLLHICYHLETSPVDFLTRKTVVANSDRLATRLEDKRKSRTQTKKPSRRLDIDRARTVIQTALKEFPPPTLKEVRERIGVSSNQSLKRHFSDLCNAILSRYADYKSAKSLEEIRLCLEAVLESNKYPPPCLLEVTKSLKHSKMTIYRNFPELCRAISAKYLSYRQTAAREQRERNCQEVRDAAIKLHAQGVKPTATNVGKLLTKPGILMTKEAQAALREVRCELGV